MFRAHEASELTFDPGINLIYGPNGAGKTNILEAIHYLCLSKSFLTSNDRLVLQRGAPYFEIVGSFTGNHRRDLEIRFVYHRREGKRIFTNGAPLERVADLVGRIPLVSFAPGDIIITVGAPVERRRFINKILCQERPAYLAHISRYRRIMRQRNELLYKARRSNQVLGPEAIAPWDAQLILYGSKVIAMRMKFVMDFATFLEDAYRHLATIDEKPTMDYRGIAGLGPDGSEKEIAETFRQRLEKAAQSERQVGRTLVGPHRDDIRLAIDDLELRQYASQGQHRTFGIAIKLAQYLYLNDRLEEPPILLLDDVFDSLDDRRTWAILDLLQGDVFGQTLITAAGKEGLSRRVSFADAANGCVQIRGGRVHAKDDT